MDKVYFIIGLLLKTTKKSICTFRISIIGNCFYFLIQSLAVGTIYARIRLKDFLHAFRNRISRIVLFEYSDKYLIQVIQNLVKYSNKYHQQILNNKQMNE